jgi:PAS domain-containing protein
MSTSQSRRGKKSPPPKSPETGTDSKVRDSKVRLPKWADANCRAVLEAAPDAMLVVNRAGEIVAANLQAQELYGYSREHLMGRVVESLIPARLRDRHLQHREKSALRPSRSVQPVTQMSGFERKN